MITFFRNLVGALRPLGIALYELDASGNPTGFKDYLGNAINIDASVADWDALAAVPKILSNDNLTLIVRSDNRLMRYNHTLGYWQPVDSHNDVSIMWLGDSKTSQSVPYAMPIMTDKSLPVYKPPTSFITNLNNGGTFIASVTIDYGATAGTGTIVYNKAARTLTWAAPGDSAGAAVDISAGGWFRLESATAGKGAYVAVLTRNEPAANTTGTINYGGFYPAVDYANVNSVPAMWSALNGNPFRENQYFYAIDGMTSSELYALAAWRTKYTDITHIDITTNGVSTKAWADQNYTDVTTIIAMRKALGSRCILALPNLDNLDYTLNVSIPKWKQYLAAKLQDYAVENGIETYSPSEFLNTGNSLSSPNVAVNFNTDTVHYSQRGTYLIAKYLLDPILSKYAPKRGTLTNPLVPYDATDSPNGNLLNNIAFGTATGGTAGAGASGSIPGSYSLGRGSGSVILAVGSYVARTDKKAGNNYRIAIDNTGGIAGELIRLNQTAAISNSNFTVGDRVVLSGELYVSGTGVAGIRYYLWSSTGGYIYALDYGGGTDLGDAAGDTVHYVLRSMPFTIQSGFNSFVPRLEIVAAANGVFNVDVVPNLCLRKVV